jgi:DHA2 family multidrug resistance protein
MSEPNPAYKWWMALTVVPAGLIQAVDATSVSIAIPNMMTSLRTDLDQIQWVITISMVMQTLLMPTSGWLSSRIGQRRLFISGLLLIIIATLLCTFAWSLASLVFFRAILGIGAGVVQPMTMAILFSVFPPQQRGTAMGLFNSSIALGLIIGRFGGFLIDAFNWHMIFFLTLPFSIPSAALAFVMLRDEGQPTSQAQVDMWGILTMGGFLVPLMIALTRGRFEGWDALLIRALFATSACSFVAFLIIELRLQTPLVDLRLYRNFNFAMGSLVQFLVSILFSSSTFLITIFLQLVYDFTPTQVGLLLLPQGLVYGFGSLGAGRLSDYMNPRIPLLVGLAGFALVYFWLGGLSPVATAALIMTMMCLRSFSFSCVNSPNSLMTLRALPEDKLPMGSGLFFVSRGIASTVSVALTAFFLEHQRAIHAIDLAQQQAMITMPADWAMTALNNTFLRMGDDAGLAAVKASAMFYRMLLSEATVSAYQDIFMLSGFISLFNIIPAVLRRRRAAVMREVVPVEAAPADQTSTPAR